MKLRALVTLGLVGLWMVLVGPVSSANAYPVTTCSTLSVSTTSPAAGSSITVTGSNFAANANISLQLHTQTYVLGTVKSNSSGSFSTSVTIPAGVTPGPHVLSAVGGSNGAANCPADPSVTLQIGGAGAGGQGSNQGSGSGSGASGGTAFTGVDVLGLLAIATLLVVSGLFLNRRGQLKRAQVRGR